MVISPFDTCDLTVSASTNPPNDVLNIVEANRLDFVDIVNNDLDQRSCAIFGIFQIPQNSVI